MNSKDKNKPEELDLNSPEDFYNLKSEKGEILKNWIRTNLKQRESVNKNHNSYDLKHYFERDKENKGFYITNGQFKGAMFECGFKPYQEWELNWEFRISEKSITELEKRGLRPV